VQVSTAISSVAASQSTFTPTGTNEATITVEATPGQTGLKISFYSPNWGAMYDKDGHWQIPLTETSTPGLYTYSWDGTGYVSYGNWIYGIVPDGVYQIYVYDEAGNQSTTIGEMTISGVSSVQVSPYQFTPSSGATTTITANGVEGLNLQAKAVKQDSSTGVWETFRTIPMTGTDATYSAVWDGKDDSGNLVPVAAYKIEVWHTGSSAPYVQNANVQVATAISSVAASQSAFTPTGTNEATITVEATPGQTGLKISFHSPNWSAMYDKDWHWQRPLTETSTPGLYTYSWDGTGYVSYGNWIYGIVPDGVYQICVYDEAGNQSTTIGEMTISGVSSVQVSPSQFTPGGNNYTSIVVNGAIGQQFESKIFNSTTQALTRSLPMSEVAGTYTADWDGKDTYGNFAGANSYTIQVYPKDSTQRYLPSCSVQVNVAVFTISASPDPFIPDGSNSTTITIRADALQSGLKATVSHPESGTSAQLPLRETGSAGTYTTTWDGKINGAIPRDGICTIHVYDSFGNQFPATGTFTLSSAKSLTVTPSPFEITGASTATISTQMPSGFHLEARIASLKTLPLTETDGIYSAVWDGKDSAGVFAPAGTYNVAIWNVDTQTRYDLQISLQVKIVDSVPPNTTIVSGPAEGASITPSNITFTWLGTDNLAVPLTYAYQLDSSAWSPFDSATSYTFASLAEGSHTFSVKAKDQAENEDLTPASRYFIVDGTPPQPADNLVATPTQTGIRLDWTQSSSADIYAYKLYWDNGAGVIDYTVPFATIYYPATTFTASIFKEGAYKYALRAVDHAGNEEQNTDLGASTTITGFSVSLSTTDRHKRGEDVPIVGSLIASDSTPLVDVPVTIEIENNGYVRMYFAYTKATGEFSYIFQPLASEAGNYTVRARALYQGLEKSASASFSIIGMLLEPAQATIDMSMNSPKTVNINLRNIGAATIADLQYTLADSDMADPVKGFLDTASLPTSLAAGASVVIPVLIIADPGAPPSVPAVFTLSVASSDGISESAMITARLHDAASLPVFNPDPIMVGVRTGNPVTKTVTITNRGYAAMQGSTLAVHDPTLYSWISIPDGAFGTLNPEEAQICQIVVNPPEGTTLGTYVVQLDLIYDGATKPVYMTVEVTTATAGQVAFKIHDDTGSVVSGAEVNLISKAFYVNVTPDGRQEYNNVIKGTTDQQGSIVFTDAPTGDYRYVVNAVHHSQKDGLITVEPGSTPQTIGVIMITNLVNVDFSVTQTTLQDQYTVNLNITYVTDLIKPTLYATPYRIDLSFFPEETFQGALVIKNTSNNAPVRDLSLDASALDGIDNEIRVVFDDGTEAGAQKITIGELGPGKSIQAPYKAIIHASDPKLNNRNLGNIIVSAEFDLSIDGKLEKSTTTTPIPVLYWKPQEFSLPGIAYINDETDGNLCDLEYQGTTYRLNVKSNRNMDVTLDTLKAINQVNGGPDAASIISSNSSIWTGRFTPSALSAKGDVATFDIDTLKDNLESKLCNDRENFLSKPNYLGFKGQWSDRDDKDAYLIPIYITTIRPQQIVISDTTLGGGWIGGTIPTFNEHGTVKLQIDQKVSLERKAFNANISIKPTVTPLDNFKATVSIKDENGNDASGLFFVVVTQKTGIASVDGSTVSGPVDIAWQLIPNSNAGGATASGKNYSISATIDYNFSGGSYTFTTEAETVTVKPMPKLTIDYKLPYITMAGKPVKIKAIVTNNGYGPAYNLVIKSAQPKILENLSNVPVSFTLTGSSATSNDSTLQNGVTDISFGDIPAGGTAEGYWLLSTTKDGYFVEFTSTLTHQDYMGIQLDPLIEATNTRLIPAIGGEIFIPPGTTEGMKVELYQGGALKGQDTVNAYGNYLIPDLTMGVYQWVLKDSSGKSIDEAGRDITVVDGQPTARIDYGKPERVKFVPFEPISSDAKNLVIITHGWYSWPFVDKDGYKAWLPQMVSMICDKIKEKLGGVTPIVKTEESCVFENWEVRSYIWAEDAYTFFPNKAFDNAENVGINLGRQINTHNYNYVHLIGHSAGAKLIDSAKNEIKKTDTKVLLTFLDAFDKNNNNSDLGKNADYSEHYVDTRIWGSKSTDFNLKYAFNFDVSDLDDTHWWNEFLRPDRYAIWRHGWPYTFYTRSNNDKDYAFGFVLSKEFLDPLNNDWRYNDKFTNGCCRPPYNGYDQCGIGNSTCPTEGVALKILHETTVFIGGVIGDIYEVTRKIEQSIDGIIEETFEQTGEMYKTILTLMTKSPVWVKYEVNIQNKVNILNFKNKFLSQSEGLLSVFLDDQIVYKSDERLALPEGDATGNIPLGEIQPGKHILTFRLDPFSAKQSSVAISDISFALLGRVYIGKKGDMNYDDVVDMKDAIIVMQLLSNMPLAQPVYKEFDVNGDNLLGLAEAIHVMQTISGMR
jgi:flagellar hook assembly protein FlgD